MRSPNTVATVLVGFGCENIPKQARKSSEDTQVAGYVQLEKVRAG